MKKFFLLLLITVVLSGCSITNQTSKKMAAPTLGQNGISQKPSELYKTKDECEPHAKQGYCLESYCTKGKSNGSRHTDGSTDICEETWQGWIPINEVIAN